MKDHIFDLNKTVNELCARKPEITKMLKEIGFRDITKTGMLITAGQFMNVPKISVSKKLMLKP